MVFRRRICFMLDAISGWYLQWLADVIIATLFQCILILSLRFIEKFFITGIFRQYVVDDLRQLFYYLWRVVSFGFLQGLNVPLFNQTGFKLGIKLGLNWDLKLKHNVTPTLKWCILKSVGPYSNITKKCRLCLQEKFQILSYPIPDELLNKRSELVSKCRHMNKFLLANYKAND